LVRKAVTESIWTNTKLNAAGYVIDPLCPLCGLHPDTQWCRRWVCGRPDVAAARDEAVPNWLVHQAKFEGEKSPLFKNAWATTPAMPPPAKEDVLWKAYDAEGNAANMQDVASNGFVFLDGSCSREPLARLNRAAAALTVVHLEPPYKLLGYIHGPVVRSLPQTPQAAEYVAYAAAAQIAIADTTLVGDCLGVVNHHAMIPEQKFGPRRKYAGVMRWVSKQKGAANIDLFEKVKSHQKVASSLMPRTNKSLRRDTSTPL